MKMNKLTSALLFVIATAALSLGQAQQYQIDPVHSSATFKVKHMLVSTVVGRFSDVSGTIIYDEKDPSKSKVEAVIKTASVNTDNSMRDGDLKQNFFESDKYPEMKFTSTKVEKRGDQWVATGPLTIKDVTKTIEIPFEITKANTQYGPAIGTSSDFKINRNDYHVAKGGVADNGATVGNEISVELNVEAHPPKPAGK
jgi:polyisoprenoid-binding protein YceI